VASNLDNLRQLCREPMYGYASVATVREKCPAACGACPTACPKFVKFTFDKKDSRAPRLLSDTSLVGAKQNEAIAGIQIANFPASAYITGVTAYYMDENDAVKYTVAVSTEDLIYVNRIHTIRVPIPHALKSAPDAMYNLKIATVQAWIESSVSLSYFAFDGLAPRAVSVVPQNIPTIIHTGGKSLDLRSTVSVVVSNFPQDAQLDRVFALVGRMSLRATLVSIEHLVTCGPTEIDCNRTKLVLRFPAMEVPGTQQVTLYPAKPGFSLAKFEINYQKTCDYESYCQSLALLPDYKMLLDYPVSACEVQYCMDPAMMPEPMIISITPSEGSSAGGTVVRARVMNMPALWAEDIVVGAHTGRTPVFGQVTDYEQDPGFSLRGGSGVVTFKTPMVSPETLELIFSMFTRVGNIQKTAFFSFEYLPVIIGPAIPDDDFSPNKLFPDQDLEVVVTLLNVARLSRPFNASMFRVQIGWRVERAVD